MRTLVIRFSSLGDIVLSGAVTAALGDVEYLTLERYAELAAALPGVTRVWTWEQDGRAATADVERIIDLHSSPRSRWATAFRPGQLRRVRRYDIRRRVRPLLKGDPAPPVIERYAEAAEVTPVRAPWMPQANGDALLLVPFAAHPTKTWAPDRYVSLARHWDGPVTLLGGPEDGDALRAMATQIGERATVVAESGFTQTLSAVRSGCVAVGGDTGLTHLAAASGVKTIGLFGPTTSEDGFWTHGGIAVENALPCRPCSRHGERACHVGGTPCMSQTTVETVLAHIGDGQ